jgi:hypothetical protein
MEGITIIANNYYMENINSWGVYKGSFYNGLISEYVDLFFENLLLAELAVLEDLLAKHPKLAVTSSKDGVPPLIMAINYHHRHGNGVKLIKLLAKHDADFNVEFLRKDSEKLLTPLSYAIEGSPLNDDLYQVLIDNGANAFHFVVTNEIDNAIKSDFKLESYDLEKIISSINKIKMFRHEQPLDENYHYNSLKFDLGNQERHIDKIKIGPDKKMYIQVRSIVSNNSDKYLIEGYLGQKLTLNIMSGKCDACTIDEKVYDLLGLRITSEIHFGEYYHKDTRSFINFLSYLCSYKPYYGKNIRIIDQTLEQQITSELTVFNTQISNLGEDLCSL